MEESRCPHPDSEGEHEWEYQDDTFDHDLGTEVVQYMKCCHCEATRPLDAGDQCDDEDWFCDTLGPNP